MNANVAGTTQLEQPLYAALKALAMGQSQNEISSAQKWLMNLEINAEYLNALCKIVREKSIESQVRALASINIKNNFIKIGDKINSNERGAIFKHLIETLVTENEDIVARNLAYALGCSAKACGGNFLEELVNLVVQRLQNPANRLETNRSMMLFYETLNFYSHPEFKDTLRQITDRAYPACQAFWTGKSKILCVNSVDQIQSDDLQDLNYISLIMNIFLVKCVNPEILKTNPLFAQAIESIYGIVKLIDVNNFLLPNINLANIENIFGESISTVRKIRNLYPFEFLKFLSNFLEFAVHVVVNKRGYSGTIYSKLLALINDVIYCKEYNKNSLAAYIAIGKGLSVAEVSRHQDSVLNFLGSPAIARLFDTLMSSFLSLDRESIARINQSPEEFYIENWKPHTRNVRTECLNIFENYSKKMTENAPSYIMAKMNAFAGFTQNDTEADLLAKTSARFAFLEVLSVCFEAVKFSLASKNINIADFFRQLEREISFLAQKNIGLEVVLKVAFCRCFERMVKFFDDPIFTSNQDYFVNSIFQLFHESNLAVKLTSEKCISKMVESPALRTKFQNIETVVDCYFGLFFSLEETELKADILGKIKDLICNCKQAVKPFFGKIAQNLESVWSNTKSSENQLKIVFLECFIFLMDMFEDQMSVSNNFILNVLHACISQNSSNAYLNEKGLDLLYLYLTKSATYSMDFNKIFEMSFELLMRDETNVKSNCLVVEEFILLGGNTFLQNYLTPIQAMIAHHLAQFKRENRAPAIDLLTLLLRILRTDSLARLGPNVLNLVLKDLFESINFSKSVHFEVSYKSLNVFCLLLIDNYRQAVQYFTSVNQQALASFLKILLDAFERVPMLNIKRNFLLAMANCLETDNPQQLRFLISPVFSYCNDIHAIEMSQGKIQIPPPKQNQQEWKSVDRRNSLTGSEKINFVSLKTVVTEKIDLCAKYISQPEVMNAVNSVDPRVKNSFQMCN